MVPVLINQLINHYFINSHFNLFIPILKDFLLNFLKKDQNLLKIYIS
jgi:hypothetical protein